MLRVTHVIDNQVRELRKQRLIESYDAGERDGAFWAIRSDVENFPLETALPAPSHRTERLASLPTRLRGPRQHQPAAADQLGLRRRRRGAARPRPAQRAGAGAVPVPGRRCVTHR